MEELVKNNQGYQILTDSGWESFDGLVSKGTKQTLTLVTEKSSIILTPDHGVFLTSGIKVEAKTLKPGHRILANMSPQQVVSIRLNNNVPVYDILNAGKNRRFYANDLLVSNCEFIINDETLIAPTTLIDLEGIEPTNKTGQVRWYKQPEPGKIYVVGLDPSLGTGGDPAAIQIFEANTTTQVGEWRHNRTDIPTQVKILIDVIKYINSFVKDKNSIYYSVENNTIGEAALISIAEFGEENIEGYFLSDGTVTASTGRRWRKGFNTSHKAKITACNKLKVLVESKRMKINSKPLISELKTFIAAGTSYAAKQGETDDLVMSTLLVVRMMQLLQSYHMDLDQQMRDHNAEVMIEPLPFILMT